MLRKTIPFILISGLVLGACGTNGAVPKNNETPMEDMNNRENWAPDVRDERRGGPEIDGLDTDQNGNNGVRDGVINDDLNNDNGNTLRDDNTLDQRR